MSARVGLRGGPREDMFAESQGAWLDVCYDPTLAKFEA